MSDYKEGMAEGSFARQAATQADASADLAGEQNALLPPAIELSPTFVTEQQTRFRKLEHEGRPGAGKLVEVYVADESLQATAGINYEQFAGAARNATRSAARYDSLRGSLDQDHDLASNFTLGKGTAALTKQALRDEGAHHESDSVTTAMAVYKSARKGLVAAHKKARAHVFTARVTEEAKLLKTETAELDAINARIKKIEQIGALLDVGVGAVTGGGFSVSTLKSGIAKGASVAGVDADVTSVAGVAKIGAQLYHAKEINVLKNHIAASKHAMATFTEAAVRENMEADLLALDKAVLDFEIAAESADNAIEDRRKQYADAGAKVDANTQSGGADEGEVSESLLLGSAAREAELLLDAARDAGTEAAAAVAAASANARKRTEEYWTAEDSFEINGNQKYTPKGRSDSIGDDPDVTSLYQMTKAIQHWQDAAAVTAEEIKPAGAKFTGMLAEKDAKPNEGDKF